TAINNLVQGVYQFELRVTDNQGATGRDTVVITVNAAPTNRRPEVNAGEDKNITFPTNAVDLIGRAWDADGSIVAYKWSKVSGPIHFRIVTPIQTQTITNNLEVGIYQFELMVTDNQGATAKDTVEITVHKAEVTASFYPNPATDFIQLKIYSKTPVGKAIVKILDGKGTLALTKSFVVSQQQFVESINVSRFSSGAYFILLDIDGIITKLPPLIIQ
ncbi:MAG: T9SS type A sorting domain-containing protein, partial [Chitinophagaceae bacterium]